MNGLWRLEERAGRLATMKEFAIEALALSIIILINIRKARSTVEAWVPWDSWEWWFAIALALLQGIGFALLALLIRKG